MTNGEELARLCIMAKALTELPLTLQKRLGDRLSAFQIKRGTELFGSISLTVKRLELETSDVGEKEQLRTLRTRIDTALNT